MSSKAEESTASPLDMVKWLVVVALIAGAVVGNAYYDDQPLLYRVIAVLIAGIAAAVVAATTEKGRSFVALMQDARAEVRRVHWPTRQETLQTTGIVVLVVFLMSLLLWGLDWALGSAVSAVIG